MAVRLPVVADQRTKRWWRDPPIDLRALLGQRGARPGCAQGPFEYLNADGCTPIGPFAWAVVVASSAFGTAAAAAAQRRFAALEATCCRASLSVDSVG
jgi:hypothetical protein